MPDVHVRARFGRVPRAPRRLGGHVPDAAALQPHVHRLLTKGRSKKGHTLEAKHSANQHNYSTTSRTRPASRGVRARARFRPYEYIRYTAKDLGHLQGTSFVKENRSLSMPLRTHPTRRYDTSAQASCRNFHLHLLSTSSRVSNTSCILRRYLLARRLYQKHTQQN